MQQCESESGKQKYQSNFLTIISPGERVNLTTYSPVCLPTEDTAHIDQGSGHIIGEDSGKKNIINRSFIGWGLVDEHSAATLQEAEVVIV